MIKKIYVTLNAMIWVLLGAVISQNSIAQNAQPEEAEEMQGQEQQVEEVIILGTRKASYTEITENTQKLVKMPGSLGDPLSAITALPGVITPSDGGEPAVRGSSPSDNRYYIDGMPAGYIFHEFNTSIFDENVVQDFQLFSAGFGVQYSQATGAIFDIRLRDPKNQALQTTVTASLLRAGIFLESGVSDNSAFYLSVRKGLIQYFLPEEDEINDEGIRIISAPEDSDYQLKYVWDVNSKHKLSLTMAGAGDFAEVELGDKLDFVQQNPDFAGDAKLDNRFDSQGINWEYLGPKGSTFRVTLANYIDKNNLYWGDNYQFEIDSQSSLLKTQYSFMAAKDHVVTVGTELEKKSYEYDLDIVLFVCTEFNIDCQEGRRERVTDKRKLDVAASSFYAIDSWQVLPYVNIEAGLQYAANDFNDDSFWHPRISVAWDLDASYTLSAAAGSYSRLPDLENILAEIGNPNLKSQEASHFTLGLKRDIGSYWNWSVELYHKNLSSLPLALAETEPDADQFYSNDVDGQAQGIDIMVNKELSDRWYGWLSLSYAKSERTNLRTQQTRDYTFDTPLVLNVVGNYQMSDKWNASFRLTAKSGEANTKIIGIKPNPDAPGGFLPVYDEPFADRLPTYMRLDLRFERSFIAFSNDASWYIDIVNALNRQNIASQGLDYEKVNETGELHLESEADSGIFPSLGVSFTF